VPNRKVVKASVLYNMIDGMVSLFLFRGHCRWESGPIALLLLIVGVGGGGRDTIARAGAGAEGSHFTVMPR